MSPYLSIISPSLYFLANKSGRSSENVVPSVMVTKARQRRNTIDVLHDEASDIEMAAAASSDVERGTVKRYEMRTRKAILW